MESCPGCHPFASLRAGSERSEGSSETAAEILRCAQDDRPDPSQARSREVFSPNVYGGRANAIDFRGNVSDFATHFFGIGKGIKGAL